MPAKPRRPCSKPGCRELTTEKYCKKHMDLKAKDASERNRYYDRHRRDQRSKLFYNSDEWKAVRQEAIIQDKGLCQDCLQEKKITPYDVVDHIKPIKLFWELRLRLTNLRSLCHRHHNAKTAEDKRMYKL